MATTRHGYDHYELLSALQKCIRRGMEYEAAHFAMELEEFNPTMLWNRLKIIAAEDIGPANPTMPLLVDLLQRQYLAEKAKLAESSFQLFLVDAVVCLCRSQKSRITDDLLNVVCHERAENKLLPIPDFALDMHTRQGKMLGAVLTTSFLRATDSKTKPSPTPTLKKLKRCTRKNRPM